MGVLRKSWVAIALLAALVLALLFGAMAARVYAKTHPAHRSGASVDFDSVRVRVEPIEFRAADDVPLQAWLLRGQPGRPAIVLCHDLGETRGSLVNTAIALHETGFTVLLFDFRGHGESGGSRSTLGLLEKRDVAGAVAYLRGLPGINADRIGLYGVGMGAHAAVLAAADLPQVRVLVLDSLYPDPSFMLVRDVYAGWDFAERYLDFLPRAAFVAIHGTRLSTERAKDVIGHLPGRDLLLVAPAGDSRLAEAMQKMYESIPDQQDADGNLIILPATQGAGLFGEQLGRYHDRVTSFFAERLAG